MEFKVGARRWWKALPWPATRCQLLPRAATFRVADGVGALWGALNTMYTAVAARNRETAILRALEFGSTSVVLSVLGESVVLGLLPALRAARLPIVSALREI